LREVNVLSTIIDWCMVKSRDGVETGVCDKQSILVQDLVNGD
jgi:hypothetical protein